MKKIPRTDREGFTLIEMMVVVTMLMVLTALAVGVYRRHLANARKGEVYAMFGEIRVREEAYRAEFQVYENTAANETTYYPTTPTTSAQKWSPGDTTGWYYLGMGSAGGASGMNVPRQNVYCGYNVITGAQNDTTNMGVNGAQWFGIYATTSQYFLAQWWYANASCDNDGDTSTNATYMTSMDNTGVYEQNTTH